MVHPLANTLRAPVEFDGVGLHTGEHCRIRLHPSEAGEVKVRIGSVEFPARWDYVVDTHRATVLGHEGTILSTVEHLLSALWALRIGSVVIEVLQGREVPILDGSALPFLEALEAVGVVPCDGCYQHPMPTAVSVAEGDRALVLLPGNETAWGGITLPSPFFYQVGLFDLSDYREQIAPARTFGFLHEVEALRQQGLAQGGSLENALILDENGYYNKARFRDEPLRHKLLDCLGDLMLCGVCLCKFQLVAYAPGHRLNRELAQRVAFVLEPFISTMEEHDG